MTAHWFVVIVVAVHIIFSLFDPSLPVAPSDLSDNGYDFDNCISEEESKRQQIIDRNRNIDRLEAKRWNELEALKNNKYNEFNTSQNNFNQRFPSPNNANWDSCFPFNHINLPNLSGSVPTIPDGVSMEGFEVKVKDFIIPNRYYGAPIALPVVFKNGSPEGFAHDAFTETQLAHFNELRAVVADKGYVDKLTPYAMTNNNDLYFIKGFKPVLTPHKPIESKL